MSVAIDGRTLQAADVVRVSRPGPGGEAPAQARLSAEARQRVAETRAFIADVWTNVSAGARAGKDLNTVYRETYEKLKPKYGQWVIFDHCMPFDVTRCYDEATQYPDPRIWTAERDRQMWQALEGVQA